MKTSSAKQSKRIADAAATSGYQKHRGFMGRMSAAMQKQIW